MSKGRNIKGENTRIFGIAIIVISLILTVVQFPRIADIKVASDNGYGVQNEIENAYLLIAVTFFGGVLIGVVIQALGQIMLNTGLSASISKKLAEKNEI